MAYSHLNFRYAQFISKLRKLLKITLTQLETLRILWQISSHNSAISSRITLKLCGEYRSHCVSLLTPGGCAVPVNSFIQREPTKPLHNSIW